MGKVTYTPCECCHCQYEPKWEVHYMGDLPIVKSIIARDFSNDDLECYPSGTWLYRGKCKLPGYPLPLRAGFCKQDVITHVDGIIERHSYEWDVCPFFKPNTPTAEDAMDAKGKRDG